MAPPARGPSEPAQPASVALLSLALLALVSLARAHQPVKQNEIAHANPKGQQPASCQYEKGPWTECNAQGIQLRTVRLRPGSGGACEPSRTVRRDCKTVGCKYARGEWSELCHDGHRVRVDKLIGRIGNAADCKLQRRVTKDCRRTCHYLKSAWTECVNGTKTRNLTLDDGTLASGGKASASAAAPAMGTNSQLVTMAPVGRLCAHSKLVRRDCREAPNLSTATGEPTSNRPNGISSGNNNLTASQKRRLKLQQLKQANKSNQQPAPAQAATSEATPVSHKTTTTRTSPSKSSKRR